MQVLLIIHILGGLITIGLITISAYSLLKNLPQNYKKLFWFINISSILQIGSGLGLLITNNYSTILGFCAGLGFYLSIVIFTQSILYLRLRRLKIQVV